MTTRKYASRAQQTTLTGALTSSGTTATVVAASGLLGGTTITAGQTFTVVIDPDTALEEIVDIYSASGNPVSANTLTIVRGIENGGTGVAHSAGAIVRHMATGRDFRESNDHVEASVNVHGLVSGSGVVGTTTTQALTNKDLTSATNTLSTSVVTLTGLQTLTNKTLTSPTITNGISSGTYTGNLTGNVTGNVTGTVSGNAGTVTNGVYTTDTGTVTSTMIANGTILNADINASAAIAYGKLALTGTITSTDIANDAIVDADINTAANIAWTKIAPSSTVSTTELGYLDGVTSAIQTQIDAKLATATASSTYAPIASPIFTGVPAAPTATAGTSTTQVATTAFVGTAVSNLVASAPSTLDTLNELAAALGNDASFSTTVTNSIAAKLPLAGGTMTGAIAMGTNKITGMGTPTATTDAATKGYVDGVTVAPSNLTGPITSVGSATSIASQTGTGTKFVVDTSPTLVTPVLGVATATSINGTTIPSTKTLVVTTDTLATLAATTSAQLAGVISDETGSGSLVFATSPTLVTPNLGTPSAINLTNATNTPTDATKANLASPTFTGTVTIPTGAVITSPKIGSTYSAKTAAYTFASGDEGQLFSMNNAATQQFNIPTDATFNFAVGTELNVFWITGAGQPTIGAVTSGTTTVISTGATSATPKLRVANSGATCKKLAANSWIVFGDIS